MKNKTYNKKKLLIIFGITLFLLLLLIGSAIMLSLGVIGYYLAKIYEEVKRRPRYIVSQIVRGNKDVTDSVRDDA